MAEFAGAIATLVMSVAVVSALCGFVLGVLSNSLKWLPASAALITFITFVVMKVSSDTDWIFLLSLSTLPATVGFLLGWALRRIVRGLKGRMQQR